MQRSYEDQVDFFKAALIHVPWTCQGGRYWHPATGYGIDLLVPMYYGQHSCIKSTCKITPITQEALEDWIAQVWDSHLKPERRYQ